VVVRLLVALGFGAMRVVMVLPPTLNLVCSIGLAVGLGALGLPGGWTGVLVVGAVRGRRRDLPVHAVGLDVVRSTGSPVTAEPATRDSSLDDGFDALIHAPCGCGSARRWTRCGRSISRRC
jgi:hypothetical protein